MTIYRHGLVTGHDTHSLMAALDEASENGYEVINGHGLVFPPKIIGGDVHHQHYFLIRKPVEKQ